jgi:hypothetical protein
MAHLQVSTSLGYIYSQQTLEVQVYCEEQRAVYQKLKLGKVEKYFGP